MKIPQLIKIDKNDSLPAYQQIVNSLNLSIDSGTLKTGDKLPGLRSLSKQTGVAVNTISKALQILVKHGALQAENRSGYRVVRVVKKEGRYQRRGVSTTKADVHSVVDKMHKGIFPGAFCKVTQDFLSGDPRKCTVIHSDGSGTKSIIAYLQYRETGDVSGFRTIAHDSVIMNLDDLLCVGAAERILMSSTINRNSRRCPGEVVSALIEGTEATLENLRNWKIPIFSGGGETADVGDLTGTVLVDSCAVTTMNRKNVINNANLHAGLAIVGLSSFGRAKYETEENSGIASNGLTSARHELLSSYYAKKYPETFDSTVDRKLVYCGRFRLEDPISPNSEMSIAKALLSPTRTYAPVLARIFEENRSAVKGLIHCSGSGQTKCLRFGSNIRYIKDNLFAVPQIFKLIEKESKTSRKEMLEVFNMGHRMEIYCKPKDADWIVEAAESLGVAAKVIGRTENGKGNSLQIKSENRIYEYKT